VKFEIVANDEVNGHVVMVWNSPLDGREWAAHDEAHGQEVAVTSNFVVAGENLRFPGDTGLGASSQNVDNCRCWAEFWFVKPDGSRFLIDQTPALPVEPSSQNLMPTTMVTLNGKSRGQIVLNDGQIASFTQVGDSLRIIFKRRTIATAEWVRDSGARTVSITKLSISDGYAEAGIEKFLRNSVGGSFAREGLTLVSSPAPV
jgi:hypothetical protein